MDVLFKHRIRERYTVAVENAPTLVGDFRLEIPRNVLKETDLTMSFGVAYRHPEEDFNRSIGRSVATSKMEKCPIVVDKVELNRNGNMVIVILVGYYKEIYKLVLHYGAEQTSPYLGAVVRIK